MLVLPLEYFFLMYASLHQAQVGIEFPRLITSFGTVRLAAKVL